MTRKTILTVVLTAVAVTAIAMLGADGLSAQSCSGTNSCTVTTTASLALPALVDLNVSGGGAIVLTPPTASDFGSAVQDNGPTFTVKANRSWSLAVHTTAVTNWTYAGGNGGIKPISDLTWSNTAGGSYAAITGTAASIVSAQAKTNAGSPTIFFKTLYPAAFDDDRNSAGSYSIPLVFTLSAP
jgi:hypothetical protein